MVNLINHFHPHPKPEGTDTKRSSKVLHTIYNLLVVSAYVANNNSLLPPAKFLAANWTWSAFNVDLWGQTVIYPVIWV